MAITVAATMKKIVSNYCETLALVTIKTCKFDGSIRHGLPPLQDIFTVGTVFDQKTSNNHLANGELALVP
ncbi:hypothetical protein FRC17_009181 [Serendipita sp. 399]|nr:hypothetical protein FRC17_009181 [Serendipita sp. 399]